ncbi:MAG TPA: hypothetical protein VGE64_10855 [Xanthomonadaceae bacterium]
MDEQRFTLLGGGFDSYAPPRAKTLNQGISLVQQGQTLNVKPGSSSHGFLEGPTTQFQYKHGNVWGQMIGESESGISTKYRELVNDYSVQQLTRANKALIKGGSDMLVGSTNSWRGKSYTTSAMTTASLIRLNETTTAFGDTGFNQTHTDVGTGIMAEALSQKWSEKSAGTQHDAKRLLSTLESKFPQLVSVKGMQKQGQEALMSQVEESRMSAAISAGIRGFEKGKSNWEVNEYVQKKFAKHGLGPVPRGWMDAVMERPSRDSGSHSMDFTVEEPSRVYSGAFHNYRPTQVQSLSQGIESIGKQETFEIKPEGAKYGFMEGPTTQFQYTKGDVWGQMYGESRSGQSTKYTELFKKTRSVAELTRANKALVKGGRDMEGSTKPNAWHEKTYSPSALTAATLLRLNETTTAFGDAGFNRTDTNVGAGIMAETLHQKWSARNESRGFGMKGLQNVLESAYPQLKSADDMRKQGEVPLKNQVMQSRMSAAVSAAQRAQQKGHEDVGAYVQHKFEKHGLGEVPQGWADALKQKK